MHSGFSLSFLRLQNQTKQNSVLSKKQIRTCQTVFQTFSKAKCSNTTGTAFYAPHIYKGVTFPLKGRWSVYVENVAASATDWGSEHWDVAPVSVCVRVCLVAVCVYLKNCFVDWFTHATLARMRRHTHTQTHTQPVIHLETTLATVIISALRVTGPQTSIFRLEYPKLLLNSETHKITRVAATHQKWRREKVIKNITCDVEL